MSYSPGDLHREVLSAMRSDLLAGRTVRRLWLVHTILKAHPLPPMADRDFNICCLHTAIDRAVREVLRDQKLADTDAVEQFEEDLADLAADIKANGQRFPIMLDVAGELLIDGRNRRAACKLAGVEPTFARLPEGENVVAYIWSVNIARRHMKLDADRRRNHRARLRARAGGRHRRRRRDRYR